MSAPTRSPSILPPAPRRRIAFPRSRRWEYLTRDGVTVSTCGIPSEFREAFLEIVSGARDCYRSLFGDRVIDRLEMNARKGPSLPLRLWTNGADRVYLTINRKEQLDEPSRSGVRYLHGLPHELGHIVLYRALINLNVLPDGWGEGWAVYLGSFVAVPYLHETYGPELWPYPYDYLESEGPAPYLRRFSTRDGLDRDPTLEVAALLHRLDGRLGRDGFGRFFGELLASPIRADEFVERTVAAAGREPRRRRRGR